jgi:hypothetical protein
LADATRLGRARSARRLVAPAAIAAATLGAFLTWTSDGDVRLGGTDGPNNGWLIVIVAAFATGWARPMARGSWIGVAGVLGSAVVIAWTAVHNWLDSRAVYGASARLGLLLVVAASIALALSAILRAVELWTVRRGAERDTPDRRAQPR